MIRSTQDACNFVRDLILKANDLMGYDKYPAMTNWNLDPLKELVEAINPEYPTDSFDLLSLATVLANNGCLTSIEEYDTFRDGIIEGLEGLNGNLTCKYIHPGFEFGFSPKHHGWYLSVTIKSKKGDNTLTLPVEVSVSISTDMDLQESHCDECPTYMDEDGDGDCNCQAQEANRVTVSTPDKECSTKLAKSIVAGAVRQIVLG
jgi:hypothetical protein